MLGIVAHDRVSRRQIGGGSGEILRPRSRSRSAYAEGFIRGDDERPEGRQGLLPRAEEHRGLRPAQRRSLRGQLRARSAYASILGPIIGNIGNILYVTLALVGGVFLLDRRCRTSVALRQGARTSPSLSLLPQHGARSSPATSTSSPSRSTRSSWRGAGAERVFALHRRKARDGRRLRHACERREIAPDGSRDRIATSRTGHWAWKHPHGDGTLTYTELRGDVRLTDVDFAYTEGKDVLHDVIRLRRAGPEGRLRRRDRRGQNDHHEPHQPLLRHCRRQDPLRRHQHQQDQEGGSAPLPRSLFCRRRTSSPAR